jgi:hypothetical protein
LARGFAAGGFAGLFAVGVVAFWAGVRFLVP